MALSNPDGEGPTTTLTPALFDGERLDLSPRPDADPVSDEELNLKYIRGDVRIVSESARYPLTGLTAMLDEKVEDGTHRYRLDPEYQRRHRWSTSRKSRLIESFLLNVPIPPVFLYEHDDARYEVMDGRQRLSALKEFYANAFALEGLEYWSALNGRTYSQLPSKVQQGIDRRYISSVILLKETAPNTEQATRLKKLVFERLNSGGVELSNQESRNAVYGGPLNDLCLQLSVNASFRRMWRLPDPDADAGTDDQDVNSSTKIGRTMNEAMEDVELVLRFFAYRQFHSFSYGLNRISALLDDFLSKGNHFPAEVIAKYRSLFEDTIRTVEALLGDDAFCTSAGKPGKPPRPMKIAYDPIMLAASAFRHVEPSMLAQKSGPLQAKLRATYAADKKLFGGRSTNNAEVRRRDQHIAAAFQSVLGA